MSLDLLKQHVHEFVSMPDKDIETFYHSFRSKKVRKKELLLRQGDVCDFEGFVTKGCFKVYTYDVNGREYVLYFAVEKWWVVDIDSFVSQAPSVLFIEALEDSEVLLIGREAKEELYDSIPDMEKFFRIKTQKAFVGLQKKMLNILSKTAEERYWTFLRKYPDLSQRLSNIQIAAYLGISHEFVSKIRKKGMSK